jgi:hypothetical protein
LNSTAVGPPATATHANAAAFGNGAATARANQQVFGTASNTYTMAGIHSQASKDAQNGQTYLVTSDGQGNLATTDYCASCMQTDIDGLERRDKELADGIAIALALAQPVFQAGQTFAVRVGYGNFDGTSAAGLAAAGVLSKGDFGPTSVVLLDGGIGTGTSERIVAGRGGLTFGW